MNMDACAQTLESGEWPVVLEEAGRETEGRERGRPGGERVMHLRRCCGGSAWSKRTSATTAKLGAGRPRRCRIYRGRVRDTGWVWAKGKRGRNHTYSHCRHLKCAARVASQRRPRRLAVRAPPTSGRRLRKAAPPSAAHVAPPPLALELGKT